MPLRCARNAAAAAAAAAAINTVSAKPRGTGAYMAVVPKYYCRLYQRFNGEETLPHDRCNWGINPTACVVQSLPTLGCHRTKMQCPCWASKRSE